MMTLDTQACNSAAALIQSWQQTIALPDPEFTQIHEQVQNLLARLAAFFKKLAALTEQTEDSLMKKAPYAYTSQTGWQGSAKVSGTLPGIAAGGKLKASAQASYALAGCGIAAEGKNASAKAGVSCGAILAESEAAFRLIKKKKLNPELELSASAGFAAISAMAEAEYSSRWIGASASVQGEAGALYAEAKAVFTQEEQTLGFNVGAAAVRGKCEFAIDLKLVKITLGLSGSALSAEAGMEYSHKQRQALFSAKLAFLAGIGIDLKIDY